MYSGTSNLVASNDFINLTLLQHDRSVDRASNFLFNLVLSQLLLTFFDSFIRVEKQPTLILVHVNLTRD